MVRALRAVGIRRAEQYAKWSTVKNPHGAPSYALPYGFIQSPILATLVLMESSVGALLRQLTAQGVVLVTVYMDDISLSSDDQAALETAFAELHQCLADAGFETSPAKTRPPAPTIDVFNCDLECGRTVVRDERIDIFTAEPRTQPSIDAFARYCASVEQGNV